MFQQKHVFRVSLFCFSEMKLCIRLLLYQGVVKPRLHETKWSRWHLFPTQVRGPREARSNNLAVDSRACYHWTKGTLFILMSSHRSTSQWSTHAIVGLTPTVYQSADTILMDINCIPAALQLLTYWGHVPQDASVIWIVIGKNTWKIFSEILIKIQKRP